MSNDDQTLKSSELSMLLFGSNAALPTTEESQKSNPLLLQKKKYQKDSVELSEMDAAQASQLLKEKHAVGKLAADGKDRGVMRHRRKVQRSYHQIDSLEKQSAILREQVFKSSAEESEYQDQVDIKYDDNGDLYRHKEDDEEEGFQIPSKRVTNQTTTEKIVLHPKTEKHGESHASSKDESSDRTSDTSIRKRRRRRRSQSTSSSSSSDSSAPRRRRRRFAKSSSDSDNSSSDDSVDKRRSRARALARAKSSQHAREAEGNETSSSSSSDSESTSDRPRRNNGHLLSTQKPVIDLQPIIKKDSIDDEAQIRELNKTKQLQSSSSSSSISSSSSSSDEEDLKPPMLSSKPIFVPKHKRNNMKEKEQQEEMEQNLHRQKEEQVQNRIRSSRALVAQVVAAEVQERELVHGGDQNEFAETGGSTMPPPDDNDNLNEENVEMERKAWEVRELLRVLREFEVIIHDYKEMKELERRRNMTDEERYKEDVAAGRYKKPGEANGNAEPSYMHRYHHRGAFYMDEDTLKDKDDVRHKAAEYSRAATGEDKVDKRSMPKVMQVKRPGFANQTKYKGLKNEDTSDKGIQYLPTTVDRHRIGHIGSSKQK
jgi:microfibrillar-associated protein 1